MKFILLFILSFLALAKACQQDYQCGNAPYTLCTSVPFTIYTGIGYDEASNRVILLGKFVEDPLYIASVSGSGGELKGEYPILTDSTTVYFQTQALTYYDPLSKLAYLEAAEYNSFGIGPYDSNSHNFTTLWRTTYMVPFGLYFDQISGDTYTCEYYLVRNTSTGVETQMTISQSPCNHITIHDDYVYFVNQNSLNRLLKTCDKCTPELVVKLPFFSNGFAASYTHFYFGASGTFGSSYSGIFELPIDGADDITNLRQIYDGPSHGLIFNSGKSKMYAATYEQKVLRFDNLLAEVPEYEVIYGTGSNYSSVNSVGSTGSKLIQGACRCLSKFSGEKCDVCRGGRVTWNKGLPECQFKLPFNPWTCNQDYECGSTPYAYCNRNFCACRSGFTGDDCNTCNGTIQWNNNIPSCTK